MTQKSTLIRSVSAAAVLVTAFSAAAQAAPQAGAVIGNQAVATYENTAGDTITITSNTVETIVRQIAGVTLTSDTSENIAPGGKAFLPHIVTNVGNGADAFTLSVSENDTGTFDAQNLVFYPDANMDGVADSATPITETPLLAPGEQFGLIIEATAGSTASGTDTMTVTAASQLDSATTDTNTDTLTVSSGAIIELVKSMVAADDNANNRIDAGDLVTIMLAYSSTGLTDATNYKVTDVLDDGLAYVAGSARWSDAPDALNDSNSFSDIDATNGSGNNIFWNFNDDDTVDFSIDRVASGRTGSVTFQARITSAADAGVIANTATQSVEGADFPNSNTATIIVDADFDVDISDQSPDASVASGTDDGTSGDDTVTETENVYQGGVIRQEFVITNESNQSDSLSVSVLDDSNNTYPAGTTFRIVGADGITPVIGSVGPLAIGESAKVTLVATLPSDATPVAASTTSTPTYQISLETKSDTSGAADTSVAAFMGAVLASSVDLENTVTGSEGDGANPRDGSAPWIVSEDSTQTTPSLGIAPGDAYTFEMNVENNGGTSDSYNISLANTLPAGWTLEFRDASGSIITNTGTIPEGGTGTFSVIVTPAEDAVAGDTEVDIQVQSAVSGQSDRIVNAIRVRNIYDVSIVSDQTVQASPGGVVDIAHTITNNGNVTITSGTISDAGLSNFSGAIFRDVNNNGAIDAGDAVIDNFDDLPSGLAAGDTLSVIYRVQSPSTATAGVSEVATLSLGQTLNGITDSDITPGDNTVDDTITIVTGDVTLQKYQYIDATCDDNGDTGGTFTKTRLNVEPGQCIRYRIVAENTGAFAATEVNIFDSAPAYTAITQCAGDCDAAMSPSGTPTLSSTSISGTYAEVLPGGSVALEFTVAVDN